MNLAWKLTWLGWGDHRDVWGCSASGARVRPQSWLKAISLRVLGVWFACVYITFVWCFTLPWNKPTWSCLAVFLLLLRGEFGLWLHLQFCVLCVELLYFIIFMQNEEVAVHLSLCNSSRTFPIFTSNECSVHRHRLRYVIVCLFRRAANLISLREEYFPQYLGQFDVSKSVNALRTDAW